MSDPIRDWLLENPGHNISFKNNYFDERRVEIQRVLAGYLMSKRSNKAFWAVRQVMQVSEQEQEIERQEKATSFPKALALAIEWIRSEEG